MSGLSKKVELVANVAIIVVSCLLAVVLVKNHLAKKPSQQTSAPAPATVSQSLNGSKLSSLDVDWNQADQTVVLAISANCHFCTESADFYKRLARAKGTTRIVAVLPQPVEDGQQYLKRLGVMVDEVRQLGLDTMGVRGTPTLMLVDGSGTVKNSWVGKLAPDQEASVMDTLASKASQ